MPEFVFQMPDHTKSLSPTRALCSNISLFPTGTIPYTSWSCISHKCEELYSTSKNKDTFYSEETICNNDLKMGEDFIFDLGNRTSFAVEWGFYCEDEAKLSTLSSMIFFGALTGYLAASLMFDTFGRKKITIATGLLSAVSALASAFSPSYEAMVILRFIMGLGKNVCWMGLYCWVLEFTPPHLSPLMTTLGNALHPMGTLILDLTAYYVMEWSYIFVIISCMTFCSVIPMFILPESPRFLILKGRSDEAKNNLQAFTKLAGSPVKVNDVELETVTEQAQQNCLSQLKDFVKFPRLARQTALMSAIWMACCAQLYAFNFGWSKLSDDLYLSYVMACVAYFLSMVLIGIFTRVLGKKHALISLLAGNALFYSLAMIDYKITDTWTVEWIAALLGLTTN